MAAAQFFPPIQPEEYSYTAKQSYHAESVEPWKAPEAKVLNDQKLVFTQYWSLKFLSQRGLVSSSAGVDKGVATAAINRLTVTNFTDSSDRASLETDLVARKCNFYVTEGRSGYQGYDFYRNTFAGAAAAGLPLDQNNESSWTYDGVDYGPVNIWSMTPPSSQPGDPNRTLTYTIVYKQGSNQVLSYQTYGIELLPNSTGGMERVQMKQVEIRTDYSIMQADASWPDKFFDVELACVYDGGGGNGPSPPPPPLPPPPPPPSMAVPIIISSIGGAALLVVVYFIVSMLRKRCQSVRKDQYMYSVQSNERGSI